MPELPEVETVKNALKFHVLNREIKSVEVLYTRMILTPLDEFYKYLNNVIITDIKRKGKYLIFILSNDKVLISHLRMEGKYLYFSENDINPVHTRVIFHLDNNQKMIYDDSRCFGIMEIHNIDDYLSAPCLAKLGPEPFDCDANYLFSELQKKNIEIKSAILDQSILAGLGNIYADETLFACKLNPYTKANKISLQQCENILIQSRRILNNAINKGGSTVSSYHPENGIDGKFQNELMAYGKKGLKCPNCQSKMLKDFCNGRGTVYCPNCQKVCKRIGIYGKIASGKSTITKYYASKGYKTFSSDDFVKELYSSSLTLKKALISLFGEYVINDNGSISKGFIKNELSIHPELKFELEKIIHPLVKKAIEKFSLENKEEELVFIEVPLMYESHCNNLMDYIIGIDSTQSNQIRNLEIRGSKTPLLDLQINQTNKFDKYVSKCDFLIHNNSTLEDLYKNCDLILEKLKKI